MNSHTVVIAEPNKATREQIKTILNNYSQRIEIIEAISGKHAIMKMPQKSTNILFANLGLPESENFLGVMENQTCEFARPLNYYFYVKHDDFAKCQIPRVENMTFVQLPLDDDSLLKYIKTIITIDEETDTNIEQPAAPVQDETSKPKEYMRIPIQTVLKFGKAFPFDIFLKLADKILKLSHKDDDRQDQFERYHKKGLKFVYVVKHEYVNYLTNLQKSMRSRFVNPDTLTPSDETVLTLDTCYKAVKASFADGYVPAETISLAKDVADNSLKVIEKAPNVFEYFRQFKEKCDKQYMVTTITGFLITFILEHFDWASTAIKEKMTLASMLCDISLEQEDIDEIKEKNDDPELLSEKILQHPIATRELLRPNLESLSNDILNIVSEHHEKPDGSGYPKGIGHGQINTLSAIFIVAYDFVSRLVDSDFDNTKINPILNDCSTKYNSGSFRRAFQALNDVFNS